MIRLIGRYAFTSRQYLKNAVLKLYWLLANGFYAPTLHVNQAQQLFALATWILKIHLNNGGHPNCVSSIVQTWVLLITYYAISFSLLRMQIGRGYEYRLSQEAQIAFCLKQSRSKLTIYR